MNKHLLSFLIGSILFFNCNTAFAYLDPGTGSMILQALIGSFLFIATGIGIFWSKIKGFFTRSRKKADN